MCVPLIGLKINNRPYRYATALTIFQACLQKKVYVPRFCYHVALKIAGNCRMCLLEEKSSLKPVASCAVTIGAGMAVFTQTEMVKKAREGVLEYLLANHPLDCPICDQGGECDLQDQTMVFGADRGRFYEYKRSTPNKNLGFLVKTFLNRCIHCARCTRFMTELAGQESLALLGRGLKTEISNYTLSYLNSEVSGNIIDLCPVGALTSKPYAYRARPWELVSVYTFDLLEPFGASIEIDYRGLEVLRILPRINYEVNDEWISDRTRFYYDAFNLQRLIEPYFFSGKGFISLSWHAALDLWKNKTLQEVSILRGEIQKAWTLDFEFGDFVDLEAFTAAKFLQQSFSSQLNGLAEYDFRNQFCGNKASNIYLFGGVSELPKCIILININPRLESPVLNIKLRNLVVTEHVTAWVFGFIGNINFFFNHKIYNLNAAGAMLLAKEDILIILKNVFEVVGKKHSHYIVSDNYSTVGVREIFGRKPCAKSLMRILDGSPENKCLENFTFGFSTMLLHHVDGEKQQLFRKLNRILLPTKFYLEKFGSYLTESAYFFSTVTNIFGYGIRGTQEDWKVLLAYFEHMGYKVQTIMKEIEKTKNNTLGRLQNFDMKKKTINTIQEGQYAVQYSRVNNYYERTLLDRISPVLTLCAKSYVVVNDYKFIFW